MRAGHITHEGPAAEAIEIVDVETPEPGPDEIRLRVKACGLNRLDVFARVGHPEEDDEFPKRTGGDIVGVVDAVGEDVPPSRVGDEVMVYGGITCGDCEYCLAGEHTMCHEYEIIGEDRPGGLAEYVIVPADNVDPKPASLSWETAAALPGAFTTAYRMVVTVGDLKPAETALILGASGGVGHAALQFAQMLGATVYATTSTEAKAERVRQWADEVIDYTEVDFDEVAMDLTDGRGVDLVADHIGEETWQQSINSLAMGGRMVICGATSGPDPISTFGRSTSTIARSSARRWGADRISVTLWHLLLAERSNPLSTVCSRSRSSRRATAPSRTVRCSAKSSSTRLGRGYVRDSMLVRAILAG